MCHRLDPHADEIELTDDAGKHRLENIQTRAGSWGCGKILAELNINPVGKSLQSTLLRVIFDNNFNFYFYNATEQNVTNELGFFRTGQFENNIMV